MRDLPRQLEDRLRSGGEGLTILAVRLGAMGDILRTLPAVRLVRRACPRAAIHWVLDDRWAALLDGHADLDGLVAFPRRTLAGPVAGRGAALAALRRRLRALRAGLVLDFHGNLRSGLVARASGAPVRLGYGGHQQKEANRLFSTHRVASGDRRTPRLQRNLDLVRALGLPVEPLPPCALPLVTAGAAQAEAVVREVGCAGRVFAVLSPAASRAQSYKIPPPDLFAAAAARLGHHGIDTLVVWGPGEESMARDVAARAGATAHLAPPTDLATLAALIARARLYVGADSGPMHLACATGCPVVAIYGPTDPVVNGPWGVASRTVSPPGRAYTGIKRQDRALGFEGLSPHRVANAVDSLLAEIASSH